MPHADSLILTPLAGSAPAPVFAGARAGGNPAGPPNAAGR